jgi:Uma2 family endonuclease
MATDQPRTKRRLFRLSLSRYEAMGKTGLLTPADRVELLDGLLVEKMTEGPRHATTKHRVYKALEAALPEGWHARMENPVRLPRPRRKPSEPEPDVSVLRGPLDAYDHRHPGPDDTALVVEVADSSLGADLKGLARYARHRIPCVWIVNLPEEHIEVYSAPAGRGKSAHYEEREVKDRRAVVAVLLDGVPSGPVHVASIFP